MQDFAASAQSLTANPSGVTSALSCPRDGTQLRRNGNELRCEQGHQFAIEEGLPVLTDEPRREELPGNMSAAQLGSDAAIDPFVNQWIVNTNGNLYWNVRGKLKRYPIPAWPFAAATQGDARTAVLVDLGCGWGRWCVAAARAGYSPIGIDPHVDALQAARRVTRQLGVSAEFVCTDAEHLPFRSESIGAVFSYSVLQHLEKDRARKVLVEVARILHPEGVCWIQLPNKAGLRNLYLRARRGFRPANPETFEMRYWSCAEIVSAFEDAGFVGIRISADGFFSQNPQLSDLDLVSTAGKLIVPLSFSMSKLSRAITPLARIADSLWVEASKPANL